MTTSELARLLLPDQPAGKFVSHELGELGPHGEPMSIVTFFYLPVSVGNDLCQREGVSVSLQPSGTWQPGQDSPVQFSRASRSLQLAAAPGCRLKPGGYFAWVQPEDAHPLAPQALRRLLSIQVAAQKGAPLPVAVSCHSEPPDQACNRTPRELVASLTLDRIYIIQPTAGGWQFSLMPNGPGLQRYWNITLSAEDAPDSSIILSWRLAAPF